MEAGTESAVACDCALNELGGHDGSVYRDVVCAAGKKIFSGGWDDPIRAWKLKTGQQAGETSS